jgi:prevent-host-death family protein
MAINRSINRCREQFMVRKQTSTVTATEARVHFGEIMRRAEGDETIVVERSGEPKVVIMSIENFERLSEGHGNMAIADDVPEWRRKLEEVREKASQELAGKNIDWAEVIHEGREERSRQILETFEAGRRTLAAEQGEIADE